MKSGNCKNPSDSCKVPVLVCKWLEHHGSYGHHVVIARGFCALYDINLLPLGALQQCVSLHDWA